MFIWLVSKCIFTRVITLASSLMYSISKNAIVQRFIQNDTSPFRWYRHWSRHWDNSNVPLYREGISPYDSGKDLMICQIYLQIKGWRTVLPFWGSVVTKSVSPKRCPCSSRSKLFGTRWASIIEFIESLFNGSNLGGFILKFFDFRIKEIRDRSFPRTAGEFRYSGGVADQLLVLSQIRTLRWRHDPLKN